MAYWRQKVSHELKCQCPEALLYVEETLTDGIAHFFGAWNIECPEPPE